MAHSLYSIGVDIGTSSTKALLINQRGQSISHAAVAYPLSTPSPAIAEQNPDEIFSAVVQTVSQVIKTSGIKPDKIGCLAFSTAMHSLIAVDRAGKLLTQCITWADSRSAPWAAEIKQSGAAAALYQRTGVPMHAMLPLSKILWLRQEHAEIFDVTFKFISIKEYVFYRLFQQFVVDHSVAAATGLFNLRTLDWDAEALLIAGITPEHLSELVPVTHICQSMPTAIAQTLGIHPQTPVVVGAGDGALSNLGLGAIAPGTIAITVGTSGAVRTMSDRPVIDPNQQLFCYMFTPNLWVLGGAVNHGGVLLKWLRHQLALADSYEALMALAETIPPGSGGLVFHPYLLGERSPLWNSEARGSFFGLTMNHTKAHLVRAVLEGLTMNLHLVFAGVEKLTGMGQIIKAAGGLTGSSVWRQMLTDMVNQEIIFPKERESSGLGAALLGLYAIDAIVALQPKVEDVGAVIRHQPIRQNVEVYQRLLPIYQQLLSRFQTEYKMIAQFQAELG